MQECKHPLTGKWEMATWCDNTYGGHNYGVYFQSDDTTYDPRVFKIITREGAEMDYSKEL